MAMLGNWLRPWPSERVVGQIVAISGEMLECRSPGGVAFHVRLADVRAGKIKLYHSVALDAKDDVAAPRFPLAVVGLA